VVCVYLWLSSPSHSVWHSALLLHDWLSCLNSTCNCTSNGWQFCKFTFLRYCNVLSGCTSMPEESFPMLTIILLSYVSLWFPAEWASSLLVPLFWIQFVDWNMVVGVCTTERYSQGHLKYASGIRNLYSAALFFWVTVTTDTRSIICLSCTGAVYHFLSRICQSQQGCKLAFPVHYYPYIPPKNETFSTMFLLCRCDSWALLCLFCRLC
jgi:hypothetical protein